MQSWISVMPAGMDEANQQLTRARAKPGYLRSETTPRPGLKSGQKEDHSGRS